MEKTPGQACRKQTEQRTRGDKGCKHKHRVSQETQQEVIRKTRQGKPNTTHTRQETIRTWEHADGDLNNLVGNSKTP